MASTDGVGSDQPQDSRQDEAMQTSSLQLSEASDLAMEPATPQLQTPRQGDAAQTSSLLEVSGEHHTVIHAGPGCSIYLGHPASVERTGFGVEHSTDTNPPPVEYSAETEQNVTTFDDDRELDLTNTEQPAIAGPELNPSTDPWVRWTPEGKDIQIRLPKEFRSPNIQSSVTGDAPCPHCPMKEAQIKTLQESDQCLRRDIASLNEKLQKATSYSDKMVEERNSYISKYNQLHDLQIETYTELARVKEERDRHITESRTMKEEKRKMESICSKEKDVSASKSFENRRKMAELEQNLKKAKDDVKYWREKSDGQSRQFVKVTANHERAVKGLQREVNDLLKEVESSKAQVQHLEEELEQNVDSKLMQQKVQCELDLQRTREDLSRAEAEIKRKETDLNGKERALSRLERKLQLTEQQKIEADNRVRSLEEMVDRKEKKLMFQDSRLRELTRRASVPICQQNAKPNPGQSGLSPRQYDKTTHTQDRLNSISENDEVTSTSSPVRTRDRRMSYPGKKAPRKPNGHRWGTL